MPKTTITVGPRDAGRRMSLEEFDTAEGQPGHLYELSRGVVTVVDVPNRRHLVQVDEVRHQLSLYRRAHPDRIITIAGGGECKILLAEDESERHPDIAVYTSAPIDEDDLWATWIPDLVVEVISPESAHRDYVEKRQEYLAFGIREYWIIDADRGAVLVLRRWGGRWTERVLRPPVVSTTKILPGFEFNCAAVFEAAQAVGG
jgi:Uma2 family endonuclease